MDKFGEKPEPAMEGFVYSFDEPDFDSVFTDNYPSNNRMSLIIQQPPPQQPSVTLDVTPDKSSCYWASTWNRLRSMRSTVELCDLSLQSVDGVTFPAHSAVLAASSEVYYTHCMRNNESRHNAPVSPLEQKEDGLIIVPQLSGTALKVTLNFVYGTTPKDEADFPLLLQGGEVLGIPGAVACARQKMKVKLEHQEVGKPSNNVKLAINSCPVQANDGLSKKGKPAGKIRRLPSDQVVPPGGDSGITSPTVESPTSATASIPAGHNEFIMDLSITDMASSLKCPHLKKMAGTDAFSGSESPDCLNSTSPDFPRPSKTNDDNSLLMTDEESREGALRIDIEEETLQKADCLQADNQGTPAPPKAGPTEEPMNERPQTFENMHELQELEDIINSTEPGHGSGPTVKPVQESYKVDGECSNGLNTTTQSSQIDIKELICPFAQFRNQDAAAVNGDGNNSGHVALDGNSPRDPSMQCPFLKSLGDELVDPSTLSDMDIQEQIDCCNTSGQSGPAVYNTKIVESLRMLSTDAAPTTPSVTASVDQGKQMNDNYKQTSDWITQNQQMYQQQQQPATSFNAAPQKFIQQPPTITFTSSENATSCHQQNGFPKSPIRFNPSPVGRMSVPDNGACAYPAGHDVSINGNLLCPPPQNNFVPSPVGSPYPGDLPATECHPQRYSPQPMSSGKNIPFSCSSPILPRSPQPMNQHPVPTSYYQESTMQSTSAMTRPNAENNNTFFNNTQQIVYNINGPTVDAQMPSRTNYTALHSPTFSDGSGSSNGGGGFNNAPQQLQSPNLPGSITSRRRTADLVQDIYSDLSDNGSLDENWTIKRPRYLDEANVAVNADIIARLKLARKQDYICLADGCGYNNKCVDYMQSHMYRKHGLGVPEKLCDQCDKAFFSTSQLKGHTKRAHRAVLLAPSEPVECPDCHQVFPNAQKRQIHMLKVHAKGRLFTCDECSFRSPRKKDVQAHIVSQHNKIPPGVQVYTCPHCEYKCTDKSRAEEHQAMHLGQPKFVCHICNKSYTSRRGMRTHLQYHSQDRPHTCDLCKASFKVRSKLRDHIKLVHTHVGEKPYECGYCGHRTALRGNCNQHIRKHHPGQPMSVHDTKAGQRTPRRSYDYVGLEGAGIEECTDVRKHRWNTVE